jgi:small conductance mechanosensitive channel
MDTSTVQQFGNLETAWVKLDGRKTIQIAAVTTPQSEQPSGGVTNRAIQIEEKLTRLVDLIVKRDNAQFTIDNLTVTPSILNEQEVIIAIADPAISQTILLTITEADVQFTNDPDLGNTWSNQIKAALTQAYRERQPQQRQAQIVNAAQIGFGLLILSIMFVLVQQKLRRQQELIKQQIQTNPKYNPKNNLPQRFKDDNLSSFRYYLAPFESIHRMVAQEISLKSRLNLNGFIRLFCLLGQIFLILVGIGWILQTFPHTRNTGIWLLQKPMPILIVCVLIPICNKGSDVLIDYYLKVWSESVLVDDYDSERQSLRIPTFAVVLKGISSFMFTALGLLWILNDLGIPVAPILAGAGIIGFAITFASQSLIQDVINGILILWEDQYAVGDVIIVGEVGGLVESMNLRMTQLRNLEGELITVPNSTIKVIRNVSNGWSRVNFTIRVNYSHPVDQIVALLEEVAIGLYKDEQWQDLIMEKPEVLGVDDISHEGLLLRVLIKTKPLQQWAVSREFRRRLQLVFHREKVDLGVPQQIWHYNVSMGELSPEVGIKSYSPESIHTSNTSDKS